MFRYLLILFFSTLYIHSSAQTGTWNILNVKGTFNDRWSVFAEGQIRTWELYDDFYYHELKAAVNYNLNKTFAVTGGIGTYHTFQTTGNFKRPLTNREFRSWLQLMMFQDIGRVKVDHRYRIEQRWLTAGYKNRYRYRLNITVPINHATMKERTFYVNAFGELFFTDKGSYFERNRAFGGIGYKANKTLTLQGGYIRQNDYSPTKQFGKNYLQLTGFVSLDLKKRISAAAANHQSID